jgi:glycosyltransferase involved in cell wall biosynthesis
MKVGLIVPGFSAHEHDWCIPALLDYVRSLARCAEAHVFTLRWPERGGRYSVYGASVHALDGRQKMGVRVWGLWTRALRAIAAEHRRAPFTLLHAFWADEPGWVGAWAARRLGVPFALSLAGGELVALPDIAYGLLRLPGRRALVQMALRQAARVTVGSEYLWSLARAFCRPRKIERLPLGVDTDLFSPPAEPPARDPVVLNVGALYPVKDQAALVRAFRRVAVQAPEARLEIVGEGPLHADLLRQAEGLNVRLAGAAAHDALPQVYRRAAVFVQTSRHESQGMAVLEAAACGLPVVGTPVGVLPEIGLAAHDETASVELIVELLRDAPRRERLGLVAWEQVRSKFALAVMMERWMQMYEAVG